MDITWFHLHFGPQIGFPNSTPPHFWRQLGDRIPATLALPDPSDAGAGGFFVGAPMARDGGMNSSSLRGGKLRMGKIDGTNTMRNIINNKIIAAESYMPSGEKQQGGSVQCSYIYNNKKAKRTKKWTEKKSNVSHQQTQDPHQRVAPTQKHLTYSKQKGSPSCRKMSSSPPLRVLVSEPSIFHHFRHTFSVEFFRFFSTQAIFGLGYLALEDVEKDCNLRFSGVREKLFLGASNTPLQGKLKTLDWTLVWEANIFLLPRHV